MLENKSPNRAIRNPVRHSQTAKEALRNSRSLPLKNLSRIVGNYTRRNTTRLIPPKANFSKLFEHPAEDLSEILRTEEDLLNTLRSSPPKAEISLNDIKEEDSLELKKIIKEERTRFMLLEQNYKELLSQFIQNESRYKKRISELEEKIINNEPGIFVNKQDFEKLSERVNTIETYLSTSLHNFK